MLKDKPRRLVAAVERALAEAEHRRQERQADEKVAAQAQLLDLATDAIMVLDLEDRIQFWNHAAEALYGFPRTEILGKKVTDMIAAAAVKGTVVV